MEMNIKIAETNFSKIWFLLIKIHQKEIRLHLNFRIKISELSSNLEIFILLTANAYKLVILCNSIAGLVSLVWYHIVGISFFWCIDYKYTTRELESDLDAKSHSLCLYTIAWCCSTCMHQLNTNPGIVPPITKVALNFLFNRI